MVMLGADYAQIEYWKLRNELFLGQLGAEDFYNRVDCLLEHLVGVNSQLKETVREWLYWKRMIAYTQEQTDYLLQDIAENFALPLCPKNKKIEEMREEDLIQIYLSFESIELILERLSDYSPERLFSEIERRGMNRKNILQSDLTPRLAQKKLENLQKEMPYSLWEMNDSVDELKRLLTRVAGGFEFFTQGQKGIDRLKKILLVEDGYLRELSLEELARSFNFFEVEI